jgi:tetratricopeptide (TPR) repeat protein
LVPVIGLVQVGLQARADRYTYIPFIGLFIMLVWGADSFLKRWQGQRRIARILAILALLVCLGLARQQLSYWQDSVALCSRAVAVTTDNAFAHNNLGVALAQQGKLREATAHYAEAVRIKPNYTQARYNLGVELAATGELEQAAVQFSEALKLDAKSEILHNNLGVVLAQQNKTESAIEHFQRAFELNPHYPKPYLNYAVALQQQGEAALAITNYYRALELEPDWPEALDKLAFLLATCPIPQYHDPGKALILALRATELTRRSVPDYFSTLALAYGAVGDLTNAVAAMEMARGQAERKGLQTLSENLNRDLELYRAGKCPEVDWRNPRSQTQSAKPRHETQLRVRHTTGR